MSKDSKVQYIWKMKSEILNKGNICNKKKIGKEQNILKIGKEQNIL